MTTLIVVSLCEYKDDKSNCVSIKVIVAVVMPFSISVIKKLFLTIVSIYSGISQLSFKILKL